MPCKLAHNQTSIFFFLYIYRPNSPLPSHLLHRRNSPQNTPPPSLESEQVEKREMRIIISILPYILLFLSTLLSYPLIIQNKKRRHQPKHDSPSTRSSGNRYKLPPGSMGWPYIGETLSLYSQDPNIFFTTKEKRYVRNFRQSL